MNIDENALENNMQANKTKNSTYRQCVQTSLRPPTKKKSGSCPSPQISKGSPESHLNAFRHERRQL